jgi:hypothetical protein
MQEISVAEMTHVCGGLSWDDFLEYVGYGALILVGFGFGFAVGALLYID